jgi:hypothetical protein
MADMVGCQQKGAIAADVFQLSHADASHTTQKQARQRPGHEIRGGVKEGAHKEVAL